MKHQTFFVCVVAVSLFAGAAQTFVAQLDTATATQCRTHDWPENKHDTMMDWCISYGYPTN